ncbi:nucleolar protein 16 [Stigmatopora argus]
MPKAKKTRRKMKFNYNKDRKKQKKRMMKKVNPRIENKQIRDAWNPRKSIARNLRDMGLASDPNLSLSTKKESLVGSKTTGPIVIKPYVINQLQEEANLPRKNTASLSSDLIQYVQHMIREHKEDYKAMARDEKNYYQDTPKQIRGKIMKYKNLHTKQYEEFVASLAGPTS